ncbi:hypothetical protein RSO41_13285 [Halomonas sp. I1]|uniref:hypothetical protein n=1 Tax=Halomonas sp. I1 TaxID=393536 RepID=UPI0028DFFA79|nr:hypothetical protein [Halomonas sp. I1]MDT8895625.1 hypothetical protein [Halomonas sp. I1]
MAGLDTRGLASGFNQGFGLMNQYIQQENKNERAERRMDMKEQRFGLQMETAQMEKEKLQREQDMEKIKFAMNKGMQGLGLADEEIELFRKYPRFEKALMPATDQSIAKAERVVDPNQPDDLNDPDGLAAMNQLFGDQINKGDGGRKRIVGSYPSPDGESLMFDLEVEGPDGQTYTAPMTEGRSADSSDDTVKPVDVGEAARQVQGMKKLRSIFQSPEGRERAAKMLRAIRGDGQKESWSVMNHPQLGMIQVNDTTGEIEPLSAGAGSPYEDQGTDYWSRPTATQRDARFLVENGIAEDMKDAWNKLNTRSGRDEYGMSQDHLEYLNDRIAGIDRQLKTAAELTSGVPKEEVEALREERARLQDRASQVGSRLYKDRGRNPSNQGQGWGGSNSSGGDSEVSAGSSLAGEGPVKIENDSDYEELSSGTVFVGPDGVKRRKP